MNLEPAPRLPKWIFFAIDAGLLTTAFIIVFFNDKDPYAPLPLVSAVVCVVLAALIALVPFLVDYAADSAEYVQSERMKTDEQVQRLHAASESMARAAAQIKTVEEAVHKTAHAAENLPYRMQEKLVEFNAALAEKEETDREALEEELEELRAAYGEQFKATAEKMKKAATDWSALEAASAKQLSALETAASKIQGSADEVSRKFEAKLASALAALEARISRIQFPAPTPVPVANPPPAAKTEPAAAHDAKIQPASAPAAATLSAPASAPVTAQVPATPPATVPAPAPASVSSVSRVESSPPAEAGKAAEVAHSADQGKNKKPRVPHKSKPEETLAALSGPAADDEEGLPLIHAPVANARRAAAQDDLFQEEPPQAATSADGATRLLATAYIGIGNKLFIRGEGPGLSWEKGVPMQFVSIGKWGWATNDATAPVRCELYKNDETAALTGEVVLPPGKHVEITALF